MMEGIIDKDDREEAEAEQTMPTTTRSERLKQRLNSVLDDQNNFPERQRTKIDELVEDFLNRLENDVHGMVTDTRYGDEYRGLDSSRDTEAEVETAIRHFPEVLSRQKVGTAYNVYPIHCMFFLVDNNNKYVCNLRAVSFVLLLAQLALEFHSFEDDQRGGLVFDIGNGNNILYDLACFSSHSSYDEDHHRRDDNVFLEALRRLGQANLFKKEDVRRYRLVHFLCERAVFAETRFRFLVHIDPSSLLRNDNEHSMIPLHWAVCKDRKTIELFRIIFDACIRYFPYKKGINLLFQKDIVGNTPFQCACIKFKRDDVVDVIESTLARYSNDGTPLNIMGALMMATIDDNIRFDIKYFLLRRQPDLWMNANIIINNNVNVNVNPVINNNENENNQDGGVVNDNDIIN